MILAGDIGGTSARLALFARTDGGVRLHCDVTYPSRDYPGLAEIAQAFLGAYPTALDAVCFGIAGPVQHGRVKTPNLPWTIEAHALANALGIARVELINDLEANAWGIDALGATDVVMLQAGSADPRGNAAVIAAGTGLGQAGLYWDGRIHRPFASEGGHVEFAPRTALEAELLAHLLGKWDHVSVERVLSGPGLVTIYEFLKATGRERGVVAVAERMQQDDPAKVIAEAAESGECPLCRAALELFVAVYGAVAGNLALTLLATGGVWIGGGIAPKILSALATPRFIAAFRAKGRMRALMESIPVRVILNPKTALLGAGRYAAISKESS